MINATGVILHTNLGRAPLAAAARDAVSRAAEGYCNLELDLDTGARGSRQDHVEALLRELTGAEAALAVNNGAAAVLLRPSASGAATIIVSRGQLVEIGGGFRIPEVIAQSGARLIEVGTTNRTRLRDYEAARGGGRWRGRGDPARPSVELPHGRVRRGSLRSRSSAGSGFPSSTMSAPASWRGPSAFRLLADEPPVRRSIKAGAELVCCSADKLLGGPQAGLLLGEREAVESARAHPLARALRIDKLSLAALEATLMLYRDPALARREIPVLAMLDVGQQTLRNRCAAAGGRARAGGRNHRRSGRAGGGALPLLELEGPAVALNSETDPVALMRRCARAIRP